MKKKKLEQRFVVDFHIRFQITFRLNDIAISQITTGSQVNSKQEYGEPQSETIVFVLNTM